MLKTTHMHHTSINTSILCFMLLNGCSNKPGETAIPRVFVNTADPALKHSGGLLLLGQGPFSGWQYAVYDTGDTALLVPFYNGREAGVSRSWYPNRQMKELRHFDNGRKTGQHKGWWENGQLRFVYHFANDEYEGTVQEWYPDGQMYRSMQYAAGKETGLQQIWRPNGTLHANYEAVDGRFYGLTGNMHCKNTFAHGN
jgi:antitoxin component YwqK of YwqJK toxin-antitoxin module